MEKDIHFVCAVYVWTTNKVAIFRLNVQAPKQKWGSI